MNFKSLLLVIMLIGSLCGSVALASSLEIAPYGESVISSLEYSSLGGGAVAEGGYIALANSPTAAASAEYTVNVASPGLYTMSINIGAPGAAIYFRTAINNVNSWGGNVKGTGDYINISNYTLKNIRLNAGVNTIKITGTGSKFYLASVVLKDYRISLAEEAETKISAFDFDKKSDTVTEEAGCQIFKGYLDFILEAPKPGVYSVYTYIGLTRMGTIALSVDGVLQSTQNVNTAASAIVPTVKAFAGNVRLKQGRNVLRVENTTPGGYLDYISLELIAGALNVSTITAENDVDLTLQDTVPRGYDYFKVHFNLKVNETTINSNTISLKTADKIIPTTLLLDGKDLTIGINRTLDEGVNYTLEINGVYDILNESSINNKAYSFHTGGTDSGVSNIKVTEDTILYNDINIAGEVLSSIGLPIGNRTVKVFLEDTAGNISTQPIQEIKSADDGSFAFSHFIADTEPLGIYKLIIQAEYMQTPIILPHVFIFKSKETEIITAFQNTQTQADVENLFLLYEKAFGINLTNDMVDVLNRNEVFQYFVGKKQNTVTEMIKKYYLYINMEAINQTNKVSVINKILLNEGACTNFELIKAKLDLIVKGRSGMLIEIKDMPIIREESQFKKEMKRITEFWLMKEYGKETLYISATDKNVNIGQGIEIPIAFSKEQTDVKKITYIVDGESSFLQGAVVNVNDNCQSNTTNENGKMTVTLEFTNTHSNISNFGTIMLIQSNKEESHAVSIGGSIEYALDGVPYIIQAPIESKEIRITVASNTTKVISDKSISSSSSHAGSGTMIVPPKQEEPIQEEYKFMDISAFSWAEDSIYGLLKKGILSKSEDNQFNPSNDVTRAEFVKMLVVSLNLYDELLQSAFVDVAQSNWFYSYVASAEKAGIIQGDENGRFNAESQITRQDMCVMIHRALIQKKYSNFSDGNSEMFGDDASISGYAKESVYALKHMGVLNGVGDNKFAPQNSVNRAMAAKVIYELVKAVEI